MTEKDKNQETFKEAKEPLEDEKTLLIERLKEIEEELYLLQRKDAERNADYEKRVKDIELKKIEAELEKEAKELKEVYPEFDVEKELENPTFQTLVNSGIPMKTAYEAIHLEEIKKAGEKNAQKKALSEYKKTALRPEENGISLKQGGILRAGVHSLSKKDREELAKRARKGEIIRF